MKKIFISALFITALTNNSAKAQQGFSVSAKAAPQFSFLQNEDDNDNSSYNAKATINASVGAGAEYGFNNHLGVGADALLSFQGQRYTVNNIEFNQKVNYVKVPVYFIYNSDASKPLSFTGKIGPQLSFVSDASFADEDGDKLINDTKDRYKTTTFGGVAVAGIQYKLSSEAFLSAALRFDHDFTNAEDDTYSGYTFGRAKTYNSTVGLEVGIKYMLK